MNNDLKILKRLTLKNAFLAWKDRRTGLKRMHRNFRRTMGYPLNLRNPQTHNAKIQLRKVFDRNPLFPILCDKIAVRGHIRSVLGDAVADRILLPLLAVTTDPSAEWLCGLGHEVAVKANHGSGWNVLIQQTEAAPDYAAMEALLRGWLVQKHGQRLQEWGYWKVPPRIMAEPLMRFSDGRLAEDLKFGVYDGKVRSIQIEHDRFGNYAQAYFDRDWNRLPMQMRIAPAMAETPPPPVFLDEMIAIAEAVVAMLDYARVDFMMTDQGFVLNEITLYRSSGMTRFEPREWDRIWGDWWEMRMVRPKGFVRRWLG